MPDHSTCRECGTPGCRDLFDRLLALEFEQPDPYGRLHGVTVPAWFLQHPDRAPEGSRPDHWAFLHVYARRGLDGVHAVARRRRRANSHRSRADLPGPELGDLPAVPDRVATDVTIADVAGLDRSFPAEGHERRVRSWVATIIGPPA